MLVYGKRRVGKTTLINKALEAYDGKVISFQCTSEGYESNCVQLSKEASNTLSMEIGRFDSFYDIFRFLVSTNEDILVVIDEYNELKEAYGGIQTDSMMQKIIDSLLDSKVRLIISGSAVSIMTELLDYSNPLFDRFHVAMKLKEFDYYEASSFVPAWSNRQKIMLYSIFGGSPAALEMVDPSLSLKENIKRLILDGQGSARALVENTLLKEFGKIGPVLSIMTRLGNGKRTYGELKEVFDQKNTGNLSRWLTKMASNDMVSRLVPINEKEKGKKVFYSISDNLFRFYFTYVYPNRSRLERVGVDAVYEALIAPSLETYVSYRFEDIAKEYFSKLAKAGKLEGIIDIGSYWYDDRERKANGEFDVALKTDSGYEVYDAKFVRKPFPEDEAEEEMRQVGRITDISVRKLGIISASGFEKASDAYAQISADDMFSI